jgi:hypothetical protein
LKSDDAKSLNETNLNEMSLNVKQNQPHCRQRHYERN